MEKGAIISECKKYRYSLYRIWDKSKPCVMFLMLNPSTADSNIDDATIKRCISFSKSFGYGGFYVGNIFAFRATNPKDLKIEQNPIGEKNNIYLSEMLLFCSDVICAWGNNYNGEIYEMFKTKNLFCLGKNKNGTPKHPLYIDSRTDLIPFIQ